MQEVWQQILQGASNSTPLELFAVIFGLLSVWFAKKENILVFPTGLVNVSIYVYICAVSKLYADMSINAYYFVMSVYGWIVWSRRDENQENIPISRMNRNEWILYASIAIFSFFAMFYFLSNYTDADIPMWDSMTTALFIVAMVLMARKKIEHWIAWILGDIISVPMYIYKGLAFTSFQYLVFLGIAVAGWITWKKSLEKSSVLH